MKAPTNKKSDAAGRRPGRRPPLKVNIIAIAVEPTPEQLSRLEYALDLLTKNIYKQLM